MLFSLKMAGFFSPKKHQVKMVAALSFFCIWSSTLVLAVTSAMEHCRGCPKLYTKVRKTCTSLLIFCSPLNQGIIQAYILNDFTLFIPYPRVNTFTRKYSRFNVECVGLK